MKTARDIWRDEPLAQLDDSFDRTRLSVLEEATEGGLVDIDELLETSAVHVRSSSVEQAWFSGQAGVGFGSPESAAVRDAGFCLSKTNWATRRSRDRMSIRTGSPVSGADRMTLQSLLAEHGLSTREA